MSGLVYKGDNEFGEFNVNRASGVIDVVWDIPFIFRGRMVTPPEPAPTDFLVGCAAAAAFGTGGLSLTTIALRLVSSVLPWPAG